MSDSVYAPLLAYPIDKKEVLISVDTPNKVESALRTIHRSSESKSACLDSKKETQSEKFQRFGCLSFLQRENLATRAINKDFRSPIKMNESVVLKHHQRKDFSNSVSKDSKHLDSKKTGAIDVIDFVSMSNVCTCKSGICPVHSLDYGAKHRKRHRRILHHVPLGTNIHYLVFTLSHSKRDSLYVLKKVVAGAVSELHKVKNRDSGEFWESVFGLDCLGFTKSLENTYGIEHGNHPHVQMMVGSRVYLKDETLRRILVKEYKEILSRFYAVYTHEETGEQIFDEEYRSKQNRLGMLIDLKGNKSEEQWQEMKDLRSYLKPFKVTAVKMFTKKEFAAGKRGSFTCSTDNGVYVRRMGSTKDDRDSTAFYMTKGMMSDHSSSMVYEMTDGGTKEGTTEKSFTMYQIILHASGIRKSSVLTQYESELTCDPAWHWKNVIKHFFWSLKGSEFVTYGGKFREYAGLEFDGDGDSYVQSQEEKTKDIASLTIDSKWLKEIKNHDAFHRILWVHGNPDLRKVVTQLLNMIPSMKLKDLVVKDLLLDKKHDISDLVIDLPPKGVESESVKAYDLLLKKAVRLDIRSDGWVSVDDWEKLLISFGVAIKFSSGTTNVSTYKRHANGFNFKVVEGIRMMKLKDELVSLLMDQQKQTLAA